MTRMFETMLLGTDEEFDAVLDEVAPLETPPWQICMRCGKECGEHKHYAICPTEGFGLFRHAAV